MLTDYTSPAASVEATRRVVVGVHGSASSLSALRHAAGISLDRGWDLVLVTAWPDADETLIHDVPGRYIAARGRAMEAQRQALALLGPEVVPRVETVLVNARPAPALVAHCAPEDLLVVGAGRGDGARDRHSVGADCVGSTPCPVVVVDPSEDDPT